MLSNSNRKPASAATTSGDSKLYSARRARQLHDLLSGVRSQGTQRIRAMRDPTSLEEATLGDEGDSAASDENRELIASLAQLAGSRVAAVEGALERLREGRYGTCEECEDEIPIERLQAMPWTVLCVDCQRKRENASRHLGIDRPALWADEKEIRPVAAGNDIADGPMENGGVDQGAPRRLRGRPRKEGR
jgi:RNA polymerase-binding transcription factor